MSSPKSLSVIIPTKNRANALRDTLPTLLNQTAPASEILIVDQSDTDETRTLVNDSELASASLRERAPKFIYICEPNLTCAGAARNVAIDRASGGILVFLDDDVLLEPDFLQQLLGAYQQQPNLGGVSGVITNYPKPSTKQRWITRIFWTGPFRDDRQEIYRNCDALRNAAPFPTRKFGAGLMSITREALGDIRFHPTYRGSGEDVDVSWRVSEHHPLVISPRARLVHVRTGEGPTRLHWLAADMQGSYFQYRRLWKGGLGNWLSFAWLHIGYATLALLSSIRQGSTQPLRAFREGLRLGAATG